MIRIVVILPLLLLLTGVGKTQCGLGVLDYQDSLCTEIQQTIVNDSSYAGTIGFDLSHEVFYDIDTIYGFGSVSTTIPDATNSSSCVQDTNGSWHCFTKAPNMNTIVRFDYGTSLLNTPTKTTIYTYPTSYTLNTGTRGGIRFVRANGQWYGLTMLVAGRIAIMNFSDGLMADSVEVAVHFNGPYFPSPADLDIEIVDDSIVVMVINSGGEIAAMNLGPQLTWPPIYGTVIDPINALDLSAGRAIEIIHDCGTYHVFATGITRRKLNHLNYGSSLFSTAPSYTVDETNLNYPTQMRASHAGDNWQVWVKHRALGFTQYQYSPGLTSLDTSINYTSSTSDINGDGFDLLYDNGKHRAVTMSTNKVLSSTTFDETVHEVDSLMIGDSVITSYSEEGSKRGTAVYQDVFGQTIFTPFFTWVRSSPNAAFDISNFCLGDSTQLIDQSTGIMGIQSWQWSFGDSSSSTLQSPAHVYLDTGTYEVTLDVLDSNGCIDASSNLLQIAPLPSAAIWNSLPCQGEEIVFADSSTHPGFSSLDSSLWVFNDSIIQDGQTAYFYAPDSTEVSVRLYTYSDYGCVDSTTVIVDILPSPVVSIDIDSTCFGDSIRLINNTQSAVSFTSLWSFGDGDSAASFDATHLYQDTGNYQLVFAATSTGLCSDTFSVDLRISPAPLPGIQLPSGNVCTYEGVVFGDSSNLFGEDLFSTIWIFQGDTHSTLDWTTQFSSSQNNATIYHGVTVGTACTKFVETTIDVLPGLNSQYSVGSTCLGDATPMIGQSAIPAGQSITTSFWSFGDGNNASEAEPSHTYSDTGFYSVQLTQMTDSGCEGNWDTILRVGSRPFVDFDLTPPICTNVPFEYALSSTLDPYDQIILDQWVLYGDTTDVSDGLVTDSGGAKIPLVRRILTELGCDVERVKEVKIGNTPAAIIHFDTTCAQTRMQFSDAYSGTNYAWHWTIDHQYELFIDDPGFVFQDTGLYPVSLDVTELSSGCIGYGDTQVVVSGFSDAQILRSTLCMNQRNELALDGRLTYDRFARLNWNINGIYYTGESISPVIDQMDADIEVSYETVHGCEGSLIASDSVRVLPQIEPQATPGATPLELEFSIKAQDWISEVSWEIEESNYSDFEVSHLFSAGGFYPIEIQYTDTFGCSISFKRLVTVGQPEVDLRIERLELVPAPSGSEQIRVTVSNYSQLNVDSVTLDFRGNTGLMIREGFGQGLDPGSQRTFTFSSQLVADTSSQYCTKIFAVGDVIAPNGDELCLLRAKEPIGNFFPNPTFDGSHIVLDLPSGSLIDIFISSGDGRLIRQEEIEIQSGSSRDPYYLDASTLSRGVYLVEFVDRKNPALTYVRKLIKL